MEGSRDFQRFCYLYELVVGFCFAACFGVSWLAINRKLNLWQKSRSRVEHEDKAPDRLAGTEPYRNWERNTF